MKILAAAIIAFALGASGMYTFNDPPPKETVCRVKDQFGYVHQLPGGVELSMPIAESEVNIGREARKVSNE